MPGSYSLYDYSLPWYLTHLQQDGIVLRSPSLQTGIEYQGIQHYTPVDFFGGEEALAHRQELDRRKSELCRENGIRLIEWPYSLEPTEENVRKNIFP